MAAAIAVFALSYMVCSVLADVGSFPNYTLKLKENDNPSCSNGKTLVVSDASRPEGVPVCSTISTEQLITVCGKVDECAGSAGVITSHIGLSLIPLIIGEDDSLTLYSDDSCEVNVLCYEPDSQCYLPTLENGKYEGEDNTVYTSELLDQNERVTVKCNTNYTWQTSDSVTCIQISSGVSRLSSTPLCVPLSPDNLMTFTVNVTTASNFASLTGVKEEYLSASEEGSILNKPDQLNQYCGVVYCVIPNTVFDQSSITSEEGGPDNFALLLGEHSDCFQSAILSLFLMGLQSIDTTDIFKDYDTRPGIVKRALVDNSLEVRLNKLDLVYELQEQRNTGVRVVFYIFQYGTVLSPSVVTKVMEQVPREKYDIVLESYCRLQKCPPDKNYSGCSDIPTMQFSSLPRPALPCSYQGDTLQYGEAIAQRCSVNQYNNESDVTVCIYGNKFNPETLPTCAVCGGLVVANSLKGPDSANGLNSRGAHCVWDITREHDNIGIFYQNVKADRSKCQNPVSYLKLTEFTADGKAIEKEQEVCYGVIMYLGPRFKIEFLSNSDSDADASFTFEFEPRLPDLPWYRRYLPILIAAPVVVVFLLSLVFLGLYCDHRNRHKVKQVVSHVLEQGDHTSNGTWKANEGFHTSSKDIITEPVERTLTPQPRIHNAVPKNTNHTEKKKSKSKTSSIENNQAEEFAKSPSGYGSWVMSNPGNNGKPTNHGNNKSLATSPTFTTSSNVDGSSLVQQSPAESQGGKSNTTLSVPDSQTQGEQITPRPRRRKRRKKKIGRPSSDVRPLPHLNGANHNGADIKEADLNGTNLKMADTLSHGITSKRKSLPPLDGGIENNLGGERALPPITNNDPSDRHPFVSRELGVD